jgi:hypothetical protein
VSGPDTKDNRTPRKLSIARAIPLGNLREKAHFRLCSIVFVFGGAARSRQSYSGFFGPDQEICLFSLILVYIFRGQIWKLAHACPVRLFRAIAGGNMSREPKFIHH